MQHAGAVIALVRHRAARLHEGLGQRGIAGEEVLAVGVLAIREVHQIRKAHLHLSEHRLAPRIVEGGIVRLHDEIANTLEQGSDIAHRLFLDGQTIGCGGRVLLVLLRFGERSIELERLRGTDRIVRRREDTRAGCDLVLRLRKRAALRHHLGERRIVNSRRRDSHRQFLTAARMESNSWLATLIMCAAA